MKNHKRKINLLTTMQLLQSIGQKDVIVYLPQQHPTKERKKNLISQVLQEKVNNIRITRTKWIALYSTYQSHKYEKLESKKNPFNGKAKV